MSVQSLATTETTNQSTFRRQYRRRQPAIDGQQTDPILTQYTYSTADGEYRCLRCPYRNHRPDNIRKHMVSHSDRRPYQCPDCSAAFKRQSDVGRHHRSHHQLLRPYVCPHDGCHKRYPRLQSLKIHIDGQHSPLRYRCLLEGCGRDRRPFACLNTLRAHQRLRHYRRLAVAGGQNSVLPFNEWINSLADNYDTVVADGGGETEGLSAESLAPLEVSDEMVGNVINTGQPAPPSPPILPIHKARESLEALVVSDDMVANCVSNGLSLPSQPPPPPSPPILPICELRERHSPATVLSLKSITDLMSDQSLPTAETTNQNIPRRQYGLRRDIDTQPTDPILGQYSASDGEYRCLLCPYRNRRVEYIRSHMVRHSHCRPYKCPLCPMTFKRQNVLRIHHRSRHQLLKPYVCPHEGCHKRYPQSNSLKDHIRGQHSPLSYRCLLEGCGQDRRPFACLKLLRAHQRRRHYRRLAITGSQHPVLPFNEWIKSLFYNYETLVVDGETKGLSAESLTALEVSDEMVDNAINTGQPTPPSPPILPIHKARESLEALVVSDDMVANGVSNELSAPPQPPPSPSLSSPLLPISEWRERNSLPTDPSLESITDQMSDQSLPISETTNQNIPRRQYRRRHAIDRQPTDPILGQYSYSAADGEYRCLLCEYRSRDSWPSRIRQHMVKHSDRRPYKCPLCPATYKRQHKLLIHHRSRHQLLKPYVCPHEGCHKRYAHSGSLKKHIDGQHSPLRYRCLLEGCGRDRRPFACLKHLWAHQRRRHYRPLLTITGDQHPVLPFNEWINSLADKYDTVVVDVGESEDLAAESSAEALEVSDDMVADADNTPSPPILPIPKAREVVATDSRRACCGLENDHNELSGQLPIKLFNNTSLATNPIVLLEALSMSDHFLPSAETTNQNIPRRQYRRKHCIDGQPMDPILGQYSYSAADGEYRCLLCQYCSRNRRPNNIRQHMVSHSDRRPYKCPLCPMTYKRQHVLSLHHRSRHQLLKLYVCPHEGCHKRYAQNTSLKEHIDGQHSPLSYRCLLPDGEHRCSRRRPFTCLKQLRKHQRLSHYRPLLTVIGGQHPMLSFNEWINSLADNYDTVVVDTADKTNALSTESSAAALEVVDDMVANADNSGRHAPPPLSPPILPIRKAREVVATDGRRACDVVDTDHHDLSGQLSTTLFNNISLATDPEILSMSDQFLPSAETTNQSTPRREDKRRQPAIDGQPTDPILFDYSYSTAADEYRCLRCPYRNRRPENIRSHMIRHSQCRPYQCPDPDCPAAYKRPQELKRHHRICHQLLKPYVCPHEGCLKRFTTGHSLKDHIGAKHSPLRYRCLLEGCGRRDRPFTYHKNLRSHQRLHHYNPLLAINGGGQHPVLPFKEWIASVADNYDTVAVDSDSETEVVSTEASSAETLEVSDDIADAVSNGESALLPLPPPPSPPILPICEGQQSVPTDGRSACYGVDTDHNHITGQLSKRRRGHQRVDHYSLGPSQTPQLVYECNFDSCQYTTGVFEEIADHFVVHWDHYNRDLGHESTDDCD